MSTFLIKYPVSILAKTVTREEATGRHAIQDVLYVAGDDFEALPVFTDTDLANRYANATGRVGFKVVSFSAWEFCRFLKDQEAEHITFDPTGLSSRVNLMPAAAVITSIESQ